MPSLNIHNIRDGETKGYAFFEYYIYLKSSKCKHDITPDDVFIICEIYFQLGYQYIIN